MRTLTTSAAFFLTPVFAFAADTTFDPTGGQIGELLENILIFSNDVLIPFIIGIGFLFFVWGMFRYFIMGGADEESKGKGKSLLINTLVAFVVIIIFWGVLNMLTSSTGLSGQTIQNVPTIQE